MTYSLFFWEGKNVLAYMKHCKGTLHGSHCCALFAFSVSPKNVGEVMECFPQLILDLTFKASICPVPKSVSQLVKVEPLLDQTNRVNMTPRKITSILPKVWSSQCLCCCTKSRSPMQHMISHHSSQRVERKSTKTAAKARTFVRLLNLLVVKSPIWAKLAKPLFRIRLL